MNDKLKNLSVNPAPEVWDSISHSLRRRQHLRRVLTGAAVIAVTGVAVAVLLLNKPAEPQSPAIAANTVITESPEISSEKTVIPEEIPEQQISVEPEAAVAANRAETAAARPASNLPKIAPAPAMNALQEQMPELYEAQETPAASAVSEAVAAMLEDERTTVVNTVSGSEMTTAAKSTTEETPILWIPNAFAPEGDVDANRTFKAVPSQAVTDFQMYIFSRSGQEVFHTTNITTAWDGRKNGVLLPQSAYVYLVKYKDNKGIVHTQKGTVTLIR